MILPHHRHYVVVEGVVGHLLAFVVVVGALFAGSDIGGMKNNASPSCTILGQLQRLYC